ncbi:hypothetical protein DPV78_009150 [Talaromyces pinophilus]|nr:hypothetical protein DPV78_009150 [Talaromyces pinophilus]
MNDLNLFANDDIAEYGEEREERRHRGLAVDDEEGDMVDFEAVGEVAYAGAAFVGVGDDDDFVAAVDEFLSPLGAFEW